MVTLHHLRSPLRLDRCPRAAGTSCYGPLGAETARTCQEAGWPLLGRTSRGTRESGWK